MKLKHFLIRKMPFLAQLDGVKHIKKTNQICKKIRQEFDNYKVNDKEITMSKDVKESFKKAFIRFAGAQSKDAEIAFLFLNAKIKPIHEYIDINNIEDKEPILICIVKDDLQRIKMSIKHYRKMGIKYFVYIDNLSTDGTFEYLSNQPDVDLYQCYTPYTTNNREAWVNRIIAHYGFNHWYLCVDSDELFVYNDMESKKIGEYITQLDSKRNRRIRAVLLDMYSKEPIFMENSEIDDIQEYYCYFDKESYNQESTYKLESITGGPRQRVFLEEKNKTFMLTKYPLFYFKKGDIQCCSHFQYPFSFNCGVPCTTVLLHYKFLKSDLQKYLDRAKIGNYANGSEEYKKYIELYNKGKEIVLYNENSVKYENSKSLKQLEFIDLGRE